MTRSSGFQRGEMKGILLHLLRDAPAAGHELLHTLKAIKHGQYQLCPAEIYPLLASLEAAGYIESSTQLNASNDCKPYRLTSAGREYIQHNQPSDNSAAAKPIAFAMSPPPALALNESTQTALAQLNSVVQEALLRQLPPAALQSIIGTLRASQQQIDETMLTHQA
ncbi:PadR family transcriptional regulator [Shewanella sp.]|uniref:PadR family transcriptional regulator n=1 Tax=Shewanella sp. TaxID=50422 RepID=UPI003A97AAA0